MIMHRVRFLGNRLGSGDVLDVFAVENSLVRAAAAAVAEPRKDDPWPKGPGPESWTCMKSNVCGNSSGVTKRWMCAGAVSSSGGLPWDVGLGRASGDRSS